MMQEKRGREEVKGKEGCGVVDIGAFPGSSGRYSALENEKQFSFLAPWMRKATDKMPRRNDGKISEFPFVSLIYPFPSRSILLPLPRLSVFFIHSLFLCILRLTVIVRLVSPRTDSRLAARKRALSRSRSSRGNIKNRANTA